MRVVTLFELMQRLGEEKALEALASFSVKRNTDVQRFIRKRHSISEGSQFASISAR